MKIQNSSVAMASSHYETSFSYKESMTMEAAKSKNVAGAILNLSGNAEGKSIKETMVDYQKQEKEATEQKQKENQERSLQQMAERIRSSQTGSGFHVSDQYDMKIKMLRMMLAFLRGDKISEEDRFTSGEQGNVVDLRSAQYRHSEETSFAFSMSGTASESGGSITVGTGSGWIDENDSIYSQLKIWTKDENGKDHLIDLKDADVGAIYLGNADTQFSLKNDKNKLKGEIKKTGIYLKESTGAVGTLNHVDLVV